MAPYLFICLTLLALCGLQCTSVAGGNGSETTNGYIVGQLIDEFGVPAPEARVMLLSTTHNPAIDGPVPDSCITTTDASGMFTLQAAGGTVGNIDVVQLTSGKRAFVAHIAIIQNDADTLQALVLKMPGAVHCLPLSFNKASKGYVYLPGTTIFAEISELGALIDSIPSGMIESIVYGDVEVPTYRRVVATGIAVTSGKTSLVSDSSIWKYSANIHLNTTPSGADVSTMLTDFPVLIRLTSNNFNFDAAHSDGRDVRFAKAHGGLLPYEIERWDAATKQAELWVKIDTVYGNDSTQSITMFWGSLDAPSHTDGRAVFDTSNNFQGVWHFAEVTSTVTTDATVNKYNGSALGNFPTPAAGVIGVSREFNGSTNAFVMQGTASSTLNFKENDAYTVSAWVYSDTLDEKWHLIVGKGHEQYYLKQQIASGNGNWEFVEYHDKSMWQVTEVPVRLKTWKYLTGVRTNERQYLYIDGELVDSTIRVAYDTTARNTTQDLTIGRYIDSVTFVNEGYCHFDGKIDEVRLSSTSRSADWIRLCFMNQREDDRLISFK